MYKICQLALALLLICLELGNDGLSVICGQLSLVIDCGRILVFICFCFGGFLGGSVHFVSFGRCTFFFLCFKCI